MSKVLSPYGLRPVNTVSGYSVGGISRQFRMTANSAAGVYNGDVVTLTAAGSAQSITATPTAGTTAGIVGVCVGVSFVDPVLNQQQFSQYLPANAVNLGYRNIMIHVNDDPGQLYLIQPATVVGTFTNGPRAAVGKNAALANFGGSTATGNSTVNLLTGTNWASLAATATLAMRIVDVMNETDTYPDLVVKFNHATHSYMFNTGI